MAQQPFDFDEALKALQAGKDLTSKDGVLKKINRCQISH